MRRIPLGPVLVFLGVFGGGLLWIVLTQLRFDYLITEVYNGGGPGDAIWSLDPIFTILAAIPGIILVFVGLIGSVRSTPEHSEDVTHEMDYHRLNLLYVGEICLLTTSVVSLIGLLGISSLIVGVVQVSAIIMGAIVVTCMIHMLSVALQDSITKLDSLKLSRNTAILVAVELVILISVVIVLRLYTWTFIRSTTLVIASSGYLGLLLHHWGSGSEEGAILVS